jgi:hypothetical protein
MQIPNRLRKLLRPSTTAFYDQFSLSGVNFVSVILIARFCPHLDFAAYGLALAIWAFCVSFQRSVVVLPLIVADSNPDFPQVPGKWVWVNLALVAIITLVIAVLRLVFIWSSPNPFAGEALTLALVTTPTMLIYEFNRRLMYTLRTRWRPRSAWGWAG